MIEGTDGSGKSEQAKLLVSRLRRSGKKVAVFDFPQYKRQSSHFIREYLNGVYGTWRDVGPYQASLFYALDRFDAAPLIKKSLKEGIIVVANRYVASNMAHQGAKMSRKERRKFFQWIYELEYRTLGVPRPDLNVVLHVPSRIAQKLVDRKGKREYLGGAKRDIHEADLGHLKRAEAAYIEMAKTFPREFRLIECVRNGKLLSISEIGEGVWSVAKKITR